MSSDKNNAVILMAALDYVKNGFALAPAYSPLMFPKVKIHNTRVQNWYYLTGKILLRTQFLLKPLRSEEDVRRCFSRFPLANILTFTGNKSGIAVLDVDYCWGGHLALSSLELPETRSVSTGRGKHYYFLLPDNVKLYSHEIAAGVALLAENGQAILPPSLHASGKTYMWDNANVSMATLPESLIQLSKSQTPAARNRYSFLSHWHYYLRKRFVSFPILRVLLWWEGIRR